MRQEYGIHAHRAEPLKLGMGVGVGSEEGGLVEAGRTDGRVVIVDGRRSRRRPLTDRVQHIHVAVMEPQGLLVGLRGGRRPSEARHIWDQKAGGAARRAPQRRSSDLHCALHAAR